MNRDAPDALRGSSDEERKREVNREVEQLIRQVVDGPFDAWTDQDLDDIREAGQRVMRRRRFR